MYAIFMCNNNWYPLVCVDIVDSLDEAETAKSKANKRFKCNIGIHLIED